MRVLPRRQRTCGHRHRRTFAGDRRKQRSAHPGYAAREWNDIEPSPPARRSSPCAPRSPTTRAMPPSSESTTGRFSSWGRLRPRLEPSAGTLKSCSSTAHVACRPASCLRQGSVKSKLPEEPSYFLVSGSRRCTTAAFAHRRPDAERILPTAPRKNPHCTGRRGGNPLAPLIALLDCCSYRPVHLPPLLRAGGGGGAPCVGVAMLDLSSFRSVRERHGTLNVKDGPVSPFPGVPSPGGHSFRYGYRKAEGQEVQAYAEVHRSSVLAPEDPLRTSVCLEPVIREHSLPGGSSLRAAAQVPWNRNPNPHLKERPDP